MGLGDYLVFYLDRREPLGSRFVSSFGLRGFGGVFNIRFKTSSRFLSLSSFSLGVFVMPSIMSAFDDFPEEGATIGRLLAGYGELELHLCNCVGEIKNDITMVFKVMFRPRGETQRIDVADAIGRQPFQTIKRDTEFAMAIGAMRYCLKIRNQFAHCHWVDNHGRCLGFVELEEKAKNNDPSILIWQTPSHDLDVQTLANHETYFCYTRDLLIFLTHEARVQAGSVPKNPHTKPKQVKQPPLYKP